MWRMHISSTADEMALAVARWLLKEVRQAVSERGLCRIALAGGSTPKTLYATLALSRWRNRLPWQNTELWFGDERLVAPDHALSNYRMVQQTLLDRLTTAPAAVRRMQGELNADDALKDYQQLLTRHFDGQQPVFDIMLLGLGTDGHTASLFPGSTALSETESSVALAEHEASGTRRMTLTLPVLNQSRRICFMVAGEAKAAILSRLTKLSRKSRSLPASLVRPHHGERVLFADQAAASLVSEENYHAII